MIDEKVLIERLKEEVNLYYDGVDLGVERVTKIINQIAEEHNNGWIPCSERFPEDDKRKYIVQWGNGYIGAYGFTKDAYKFSRYDFEEYKGMKKALFYSSDSEYGYSEIYDAIAWQPLPAPYKGEQK